jgi:hypothetical protein
VLQSVVVPILEDCLAEGAESFTVHLDGSPPAVHRVTIIDDDVAGLGPTPMLLTTSEAGQSATFSVQLTSCPTQQVNVKVSVVGRRPHEGVVSTALLSFTPTNWNQPQSVTVSGVDDPLCDGDQGYKVRLRTTSVDPAYNDLKRLVPAVNLDDDLRCLSGVGHLCTYSDGTVLYAFTLSNGGSRTQPDLPASFELFDPLPPEVSVVAASADHGVATVDSVANTVAWNGSVPLGENVVTIWIVGALAVPSGPVVNGPARITFDRDGRGPLETFDIPPVVFTAGSLPPPCDVDFPYP